MTANQWSFYVVLMLCACGVQFSSYYGYQVTTVISKVTTVIKLQQLSSYDGYQVTTDINQVTTVIKLQQLQSYDGYQVTTVTTYIRIAYFAPEF